VSDADDLAGGQRTPPRQAMPTFTRADEVPKEMPMASAAKAQLRAYAGEKNQLAWANETDPKRMAFALRRETAQPPRTYLAALEAEAARATGGRGSMVSYAGALSAAASFLRARNADAAIKFLLPLKGVLNVERALCAVLRTVHPNAPSDYTAAPGFVPPPPPQRVEQPRPMPVQGPVMEGGRLESQEEEA
jgi:hypothetical protein